MAGGTQSIIAKDDYSGSRLFPNTTRGLPAKSLPVGQTQTKANRAQTIGRICRTPPRLQKIPEKLTSSFQQRPWPDSCPRTPRSKSFFRQGNSYNLPKIRLQYFQSLANGTRHATDERRRSGAQRGALENNFGQRFSWAPLAITPPRFDPFPLTKVRLSAKRLSPDCSGPWVKIRPALPLPAHQSRLGAASSPPRPA